MGLSLDSNGAKIAACLGLVVFGHGIYDLGGWAFKKIGGFFSKDKKAPPVNVTVTTAPTQPGQPG